MQSPSLVVGTLVLLLMLGEALLRRHAEDATLFHQAAAIAIDRVPTESGDWRSSKLDIPPAAVTLLRPNALLARSYVNARTGDSLQLLIVQCRDARDMQGHYPPVCYPAQGWTQDGDAPLTSIQLPDRELLARRYGFSRRTFDTREGLVIYGFFIAPSRKVLTSMPEVRRIAADYQSRPFGCAQVHVVLRPGLSPERERELVTQALLWAAPAFDVLKDRRAEPPAIPSPSADNRAAVPRQP